MSSFSTIRFKIVEGTLLSSQSITIIGGVQIKIEE